MAFTARSEKTRSAILTSARQLLALKGYQGTTIRAVAAAAGIDPSMVMRYYRSKEGLFAAAVDVDLRLPSASRWPRDRVGEMVARHLISRWEGELSDDLITMLLRSAGTNQAAVEHLREVFQRQLLSLVREIAGDGPDAGRRAGMVATQVLGVALCRYVIQLPPVVAMDGETLARVLGPVLQHYLLGDLDGGGAVVAFGDG
ncbi:MAG TPA: TetR family transcriptional regulator [Pseudonocardia sp.]|jgi:AcrR family transcriptional regulator|uniref:TetR/AcrR family transcriptional regulator n=1 Tax=Pseudonocardia sp. TaxID=60912 RepID=UPI002CF356E5|nr:TetR family transcriptional regulator [Pseudonocardia sp.]HTF48909.1 TetR family transcriptional regulator [Pseudonocardia sp.]